MRALCCLLAFLAARPLAAADPTPPVITQWIPADGAVFELPAQGGVDVLVDFLFHEPQASGITGLVRAYSPQGVTLSLQALGVTSDNISTEGARGYFYLPASPSAGLSQPGSYSFSGYACNGSNACVSRISSFKLVTRTAASQASGSLVLGPHPLRCPGSKLILAQAAPGDFELTVYSERGAAQKRWPRLSAAMDGKSVFLPCEGLAPGAWRLELKPLNGQLGGKPLRTRLWVE